MITSIWFKKNIPVITNVFFQPLYLHQIPVTEPDLCTSRLQQDSVTSDTPYCYHDGDMGVLREEIRNSTLIMQHVRST